VEHVSITKNIWSLPFRDIIPVYSENNVKPINIFCGQTAVVLIIKVKKGKAVPLHAMEALGGRGGIAPTHSRPRH
jgi:hypothetical protein